MSFIIIPLVVLGLLGFLLGIGLGIASKKFAVEKDPRFDAILGILPGANCGACGFPGCAGYAEALLAGKIKPGVCPAGGENAAEKLSELLGVEAGEAGKSSARIFCGGDTAKTKAGYEGINTCAAASLVCSGNIKCGYGCLGFGDCSSVCPFGAITARKNLPPEIDEKKCTACGICVQACPKKIIKLVPKDKRYIIACSSKDKARAVKRACDTGCIACGLCVKKCPSKAITVKDNLAVIDYSACTNAGGCFKVCPTKCIQWKKPE